VKQESTTASGERAEALAVRRLRAQGYELIQRNYRCKAGEIDIIARHGDLICFVEVRSRRSAAFGHPLETIGRRKQTRVIRAAQHYLATHRCADAAVRFDVVAIVYEPKLEIQLVQGAFETTRY
jgi:putative endonuclease